MRARALRPVSFLALVSFALPLFASQPARALGARMEPELEVHAAPDGLAAADPMASALEGMRAALVEIEHQRDVVWSLRERTFRVIAPDQLPPDGRYPGSVLCRADAVAYPATPTPAAIAFCAGSATSVQ
jgi:hypothetical protein